MVLRKAQLRFGNETSGEAVFTTLQPGYKATPKLHNDISVRQPFWSRQVKLDGRFPASVWEYEFVIYMESQTREEFAEWFFDLYDFHLDNAYPLVLFYPEIVADPGNGIEQADAVDITSFGDCYFDGHALRSPNQLLLHRAGLVNINFLGTTKPTTPSS